MLKLVINKDFQLTIRREAHGIKLCYSFLYVQHYGDKTTQYVSVIKKEDILNKYKIFDVYPEMFDRMLETELPIIATLGIIDSDLLKPSCRLIWTLKLPYIGDKNIEIDMNIFDPIEHKQLGCEKLDVSETKDATIHVCEEDNIMNDVMIINMRTMVDLLVDNVFVRKPDYIESYVKYGILTHAGTHETVMSILIAVHSSNLGVLSNRDCEYLKELIKCGYSITTPDAKFISVMPCFIENKPSDVQFNYVTRFIVKKITPSLLIWYVNFLLRAKDNWHFNIFKKIINIFAPTADFTQKYGDDTIVDVMEKLKYNTNYIDYIKNLIVD